MSSHFRAWRECFFPDGKTCWFHCPFFRIRRPRMSFRQQCRAVSGPFPRHFHTGAVRSAAPGSGLPLLLPLRGPFRRLIACSGFERMGLITLPRPLRTGILPCSLPSPLPGSWSGSWPGSLYSRPVPRVRPCCILLHPVASGPVVPGPYSGAAAQEDPALPRTLGSFSSGMFLRLAPSDSLPDTRCGREPRKPPSERGRKVFSGQSAAVVVGFSGGGLIQNPLLRNLSRAAFVGDLSGKAAGFPERPEVIHEQPVRCVPRDDHESVKLHDESPVVVAMPRPR